MTSAANDAHSNAEYYRIFALLIVALVLSLGLGFLSMSPMIITIIFIIAGLKAYLVLAHFVHLKREPRWIKVLVWCLIAVLVILYVGLVPDVVWNEHGGGGGTP